MITEGNPKELGIFKFNRFNITAGIPDNLELTGIIGSG